MAQQAVRKQAGESVPVRSGAGRPPGSRNKKAAVTDGAGNKKIFDFTKKVNFQKPTDFYLWLGRYPDKTGILAALYRLKPIIDHGLIGIDDAAIHRTTNEAEMTEEWAGENFGRGEYMLVVTDANRDGQREIARTFFNCRTSTKASVYDPRTLCLGETKNQDEITRLISAGVLVRDAMTNQPRLRTEADGPTQAQAHAMGNGNGNGGGEIFGRDVVGQIVLAALNRGNQSPHEMVRDTIDLAKLVAPPQTADVETIVEKVVARLKPAAEDPFAIYERIDGMVKKIRGPANAAAGVAGAVADAVADGGGAAAWAPHLPEIFSQGRALLGELFTGMRMIAAERAQHQPPARNGHHNGNGAAAVQRVPQTMPERIEDIFRQGIEQMNLGTKGYDFAGWVFFHYPGGAEILHAMEPLGVQGVISSLAVHPQGRLIVNDEKLRGQLESFLADFFEFDPSPESPELSTEAAGAGAAA